MKRRESLVVEEGTASFLALILLRFLLFLGSDASLLEHQALVGGETVVNTTGVSPVSIWWGRSSRRPTKCQQPQVRDSGTRVDTTWVQHNETSNFGLVLESEEYGRLTVPFTTIGRLQWICT